MQLYWPQHKVFFIATLALFPGKLDGHEVNPLFYKPYFVGSDLYFIEVELEEYRKAGYLKYEKSGALYKITGIDTEEAIKDLTQYLKKWQHNKLLSLPADKPPDTNHQQALLLDAIARAHANQSEPRITPKDVYGKPISDTYKPPFWELVLSYELLDNKVKVKYMDYDRRIDGLYDDNAQPFVDLSIVDKAQVKLIKQRLAKIDKSKKPTTPSSIVELRPNGEPSTREAIVFMRGRLVYIAINGDKTYQIAKLEEGGSYNTFMNYLLAPENANIDITIDEIKSIKGLKAAHDLTELVRHSGFNKILKEAFFVTSKHGKIRFAPTAQLTDKQVGAVKSQATKIEAKNRR